MSEQKLMANFFAPWPLQHFYKLIDTKAIKHLSKIPTK